MSSLLTPISSLRGIGPVLAKKFQSLGLATLEDALFSFPVRHEDWRELVPIDRLQIGTPVTIAAELQALRTKRSFRHRRLTLTEARFNDGTAVLPVVWFNQPYLGKTLKIGARYFLRGEVEERGAGFQLINPAFELATHNPSHRTLLPIYRSVDGLSQRQIRMVIKQAVGLVSLVPDHLPTEVAKENGLISRSDALSWIHFPPDPDRGNQAVRRLKFDELLTWQLHWLALHEETQSFGGAAISIDEEAVRAFVQGLPFELTSDQRQASWDILQQMTRSSPMARLLQGDVGSGKTIVAAIASYNALRNSRAVAWLVPTVVLAHQHFRTLSKLLHPWGVTVELLTGATSVSQPNEGHDETSKVRLIVGTHALISESESRAAFGLVVVDEQQRFGVSQRNALIERARRTGSILPHYLSLTATPIPRTLALAISGELPVSVLRTKPAGRPPVASRLITSTDPSSADPEIEETVGRSEQCYVVTPLISESDAIGVQAAETEYERLKRRYPHYRIGLLHGSQPPQMRAETMQMFADGRIQVLVCTSVVEVGVDVANATLMVIHGAERFGLSQLHQLRGRVGRSEKLARCLFMTSSASKNVTDRLEKVVDLTDGIELAELDLAMRGAGELYGLRQSGLPDWKIASLSDGELIQIARQAAASLRARGQAEAVLIDEGWNVSPGLRHRE